MRFQTTPTPAQRNANRRNTRKWPPSLTVRFRKRHPCCKSATYAQIGFVPPKCLCTWEWPHPSHEIIGKQPSDHGHCTVAYESGAAGALWLTNLMQDAGFQMVEDG